MASADLIIFNLRLMDSLLSEKYALLAFILSAVICSCFRRSSIPFDRDTRPSKTIGLFSISNTSPNSSAILVTISVQTPKPTVNQNMKKIFPLIIKDHYSIVRIKRWKVFLSIFQYFEYCTIISFAMPGPSN